MLPEIDFFFQSLQPAIVMFSFCKVLRYPVCAFGSVFLSAAHYPASTRRLSQIAVNREKGNYLPLILKIAFRKKRFHLLLTSKTPQAKFVIWTFFLKEHFRLKQYKSAVFSLPRCN